MDITIDDIKNGYGVYRNSGQSKKDVFKLRNWDFRFGNLFTPRISEDLEVRLAKGSSTDLLQQYQTPWTPKGGFTATPRTINLQRIKVDLEIFPDTIVDSWFAFLYNGKLERKDWPFVRWIFMEYIRPKILEELELQVSYKGVKGTVTPGTATTVTESCDGFGKVMADLITNGDTTPITTGALSTDPVTFVDQVEDMIQQIDKRYWNVTMELAMSLEYQLLFKLGMDEKYNVQHSRVGDNLLRLKHFPNITVGGYAAMQGQNRIFCSPKENLVYYRKASDVSKEFLIQSYRERSVSITTDGYVKWDVINPELLFCNDQV